MSLPPGFLDELRSRSSIAQVVGRKVTWDARKSNQAKGDLWAPCPFHHEKTASFHVDDQKGYYYCFGCHAKGDAIGFIKDTENVSFMEAVEILARETGMPMPARDPKAQEKADRRTQICEVMEQATQFYRLQLKTSAAAKVRDYLTTRGFDEARLERWEIGFAPDGWQGLWDHLTGKGVAEDLILAAGLAKPSRQGKRPYDTFRNRVMFPIRDVRGRCIAFGGRAMDPADMAKYLNSPETEVFDKGRTLFNYARAREAVGKGQALIVAEGYMDVIALSSAGLEGAVAPLGTAITQTQLELLWRISPEPVITLDGDEAGQRAAMRLIDLALPLLSPERSLRFCVLPDGQDPDDLIKAAGAGEMRRLIGNARPLVQVIWQRETEGKNFDSPERKAALDQSLRKLLSQISDQGLRHHYGQEFKELRAQLFRPKRPDTGRGQRGAPRNFSKAAAYLSAQPTAGSRNSLLARSAGVESRLREAVIFAILISHPSLIDEFLSQLETLTLQDGEHRRILSTLLRLEAGGDHNATRNRIDQDLGPQALENLYALSHVQITPAVRNKEDVALARMTLAEELAKLDTTLGVEREIQDAIEDLDTADEGLTWRVSQAVQARDRAGKQGFGDDTQDGEDRSAMSDYLQSLIDGEVWRKKTR